MEIGVGRKLEPTAPLGRGTGTDPLAMRAVVAALVAIGRAIFGSSAS